MVMWCVCVLRAVPCVCAVCCAVCCVLRCAVLFVCCCVWVVCAVLFVCCCVCCVPAFPSFPVASGSYLCLCCAVCCVLHGVLCGVLFMY